MQVAPAGRLWINDRHLSQGPTAAVVLSAVFCSLIDHSACCVYVCCFADVARLGKDVGEFGLQSIVQWALADVHVMQLHAGQATLQRSSGDGFVPGVQRMLCRADIGLICAGLILDSGVQLRCSAIVCYLIGAAL